MLGAYVKLSLPCFFFSASWQLPRLLMADETQLPRDISDVTILSRSWNQQSEFLHRDKNKKKTLLWTQQTFFKLLIYYHNNVCTFLQALDVLFLFLMICPPINMTFNLCQVKLSKFYLMWILIYYNRLSSSMVLHIKADDLLSSGLFHFDLALIIFWVSDNERHTQMLSLFHS